MTNHAQSHSDVATAHAEHNQPSVRNYVAIFFVLFVITMLEVGASYLNPNFGAPEWVELIVLIALSVLKGALVVLFYMHLRFDSRWFTFLFTTGMILATFGVTIFLTLFTYRASQSN